MQAGQQARQTAKACSIPTTKKSTAKGVNNRPKHKQWKRKQHRQCAGNQMEFSNHQTPNGTGGQTRGRQKSNKSSTSMLTKTAKKNPSVKTPTALKCLLYNTKEKIAKGEAEREIVKGRYITFIDVKDNGWGDLPFDHVLNPSLAESKKPEKHVMCQQVTKRLEVSILLFSKAPGMARPSMGSYFTVWKGPGCNNQAARYSKCGCSNIDSNLGGGYEFVYQGQTASAYNQPNCNGVAQTRFPGGAQMCSGFGWRSFFIQC
ncbi:hypothetical protein KI387_008100 [Taxus chinensis]|uniref:Uncharacterized protein n=1 Tax=Taxus chinensis TaxID=29808 RepID=A0AA38CLJ3_TAXCH|nr:hypothetical protein KI387_008100 [Taxus chinensis]